MIQKMYLNNNFFFFFFKFKWTTMRTHELTIWSSKLKVYRANLETMSSYSIKIFHRYSLFFFSLFCFLSSSFFYLLCCCCCCCCCCCLKLKDILWYIFDNVSMWVIKKIFNQPIWGSKTTFLLLNIGGVRCWCVWQLGKVWNWWKKGFQ